MCLQVRQDYASVADFIKISVLDSASKLNAGALQLQHEVGAKAEGTIVACTPHM